MLSLLIVGGSLVLAVVYQREQEEQAAPKPALRTAKKLTLSGKTAKNSKASPRPAAPMVQPAGLANQPDQILRSIYQKSAGDPQQGATRIDELVLARLKEKNIPPAAPCSDAVFIRRVYLDVIGRIPTAEEVREFLEDTNPNRRAILIDQLLASRREVADYLSLKWNDLLRVKSEFPINLWPNGVQAYSRWIWAALRENMPFDQFARHLLTSSGSNFRVPPVNFYRAVQAKNPKTLAQAVALTWMGIRPNGLPAERWEGLQVFFSQVGYKRTGEWKEEIVYHDFRQPIDPTKAIFPDGTPAKIAADQDPREVFADWLLAPKNPYFARCIANRVWSWLLGRGIIHEPDDIRPDNPPSNPELLAYLEEELVKARFDLTHLYRLILNSKTYQQSSLASSNHPDAAALFASYPIRRLEAEVLIDAICQITGTTERYYSPIPEPFTYIPENHRSITLADGSITSPFLEMFGRPNRDTGLESERNNSFTPAQRLHLLNSSHIQQKIEQGPGLKALLEGKTKPEELVDELYLTILSRFPSPEERSHALDYAQTTFWGRRPGIDLAWALINTAEFLCRH